MADLDLVVNFLKDVKPLERIISNQAPITPASNGAAERGVGQIKNVLEKLGKKSLLSQDFLNMIVFKINSHVTRNQGSV